MASLLYCFVLIGHYMSERTKIRWSSPRLYSWAFSVQQLHAPISSQYEKQQDILHNYANHTQTIWQGHYPSDSQSRHQVRRILMLIGFCGTVLREFLAWVEIFHFHFIFHFLRIFASILYVIASHKKFTSRLAGTRHKKAISSES